jgi:asparagine synthase (glutamine-hydrolysing)
MRVDGLRGKVVLREAAKTLIPSSIVKRPKVGFTVPVREWFAGEMRDYLLEHLRGPGSMTRPYYETKVLDRVIDEHLNRRRSHDKLLWTLLNLEIWHRQYRYDFGKEERLACAA